MVLYANKKTTCAKCGADLELTDSTNNMGLCNNCKCVK